MSWLCLGYGHDQVLLDYNKFIKALSNENNFWYYEFVFQINGNLVRFESHIS